MPNKIIAAWRDFDGDRQEVSYDVKGTTTVTDFTSFVVELEKWNVGASAGGGFYDDQAVDAGVASTNPLAQNSLQAIMALKDTVTGRIYTKRIPFPDMAKAADAAVPPQPAFQVSDDGFTIFNPLHADYVTLKAEIDTHMISPAGNAVELIRVYIEE